MRQLLIPNSKNYFALVAEHLCFFLYFMNRTAKEGQPMYKPYTIDQYKVYQFLEENFALDQFLLSPLSRNALMLEDKCFR